MGVLKAKVDGQWVPLEYSGGPNAENALGIVAMGQVIAGVPTNVTNTGFQLTNNIAFTPLVGRRYRLVISMRANLTGAAAYLQVFFRNGTTNLNVDSILPYIPVAATLYNTLYYDWIIDGDGAAKSYNVYLIAQAGATVGVYGGSAFFYLEDVGPNVAPALPIPLTPPAWTDVTFQSGWSNLGAGYPPVSYRKIGDVVYGRGLATAAGGAGNIIAVLPAGFRPPYHYIFTTWYATPQAATRLFVSNVGEIKPDLLAAPVAHISTDFQFTVMP